MESILSTQFLLVNLSNKEILKVSQQVESNRLRTTLFLVGFQVATRQTMLGCSAAGSAHSSHFSWEAVHRQAPEICHWEDGKIIFFHFLLPPPRPPALPPQRSSCLSVIEQARWRSNFYPKENRYTHIHRQSKHFHGSCVPATHTFSVPKGVLTICTRWEAERYCMYSPPCFTSPWHPEASLKLLVKKQAAVWWIKQQRQPLPSLPSRLLALIFLSLSVPVLCLLYTLLGKWIFSFGPFSSPHSPHYSSPSSNSTPI